MHDYARIESTRILMCPVGLWGTLYIKYQQVIIKSFQHCGISVAADRSEDHLIRIKDGSNSAFDFTG